MATPASFDQIGRRREAYNESERSIFVFDFLLSYLWYETVVRGSIEGWVVTAGSFGGACVDGIRQMDKLFVAAFVLRSEKRRLSERCNCPTY